MYCNTVKDFMPVCKIILFIFGTYMSYFGILLSLPESRVYPCLVSFVFSLIQTTSVENLRWNSCKRKCVIFRFFVIKLMNMRHFEAKNKHIVAIVLPCNFFPSKLNSISVYLKTNEERFS
jgi:hypothetical protein